MSGKTPSYRGNLNDMAREPAAVTELRRALGKRLAAFRTAAGLTQAQLGKAVHSHRTTVAHLESGRGRAPETVWLSADTACQADGALIAAFKEFEGKRHVHLRHAKQAELADIHSQLEAWRHSGFGANESLARDSVTPAHTLAGLVDVLGPDQTISTATEYTVGIVGRYELEGPQRLVPELLSLRRLSRRLGSLVSSEKQRAALARLGAQQAALLSYSYVNLSRFGDAEHFALEAGLFATALNDPAMLAWIKGTQSFSAYYRKQYREALALAEASLTVAGTDLQRIRLLSNGVARAAGKLGDRHTVDRALDEALALATGLDRPTVMTPCISFEPYGWVRTAVNAATAYLAIGDYDKVLDLTCQLRPVVAESDSDWSRSLINLDEATALTLGVRADLEHAASVGLEALGFSAAKPIASVGTRARELALSIQQRGWGQASLTFLDAVREWHKPTKEIGP